MPELPEVETVVRQIAPDLLGRRIVALAAHTPKLVRCQTVADRDLVGARFVSVTRRGKFIRCDLRLPHRRAAGLTLLAHLKMTGCLRVHRGRPARQRHDHLDLILDRGVLRFTDVRQFGGWWIVPTAQVEMLTPLGDLGPEPLEMPRDDFRRLLAGSRQRIKALLLDQSRLAGIGNIYADESLYAAGIHPTTRAADIAPAKASALWHHVRRILQASIRRCGTTVDSYRTPEGSSGGYQKHLRVYGRYGQLCPRCGRTFQRLIVAGRGTTACSRCQR
jgi:formamidopyrimidine-DNA glycosylase